MARRHSLQHITSVDPRDDGRFDLHCEMCGLDAILDQDGPCPYCADVRAKFERVLVAAGVSHEAAPLLAMQGLWKQEQMRAYLADTDRRSALDAFSQRVEAIDGATHDQPVDDYPDLRFSSAEEEARFTRQ